MYYKNHNMLSEQDWWASVRSQMQLPNQKVDEINEPTSNDASHDQDAEINFEKIKIGVAKVKYRAFLDSLVNMNVKSAAMLLQNFMEELMLHSKIPSQLTKKIVNSVIGKEQMAKVDMRNSQNKAAMEEQ